MVLQQAVELWKSQSAFSVILGSCCLQAAPALRQLSCCVSRYVAARLVGVFQRRHRDPAVLSAFSALSRVEPSLRPVRAFKGRGRYLRVMLLPQTQLWAKHAGSLTRRHAEERLWEGLIQQDG